VNLAVLVLELILYVVIFLPVGDLILEGAARVLKHPLRLSVPERALAAFYTGGGGLYLLAYVPGGLFRPLVVGAILGVAGLLWCVLRARTAAAWGQGFLRNPANHLRRRWALTTVLLVSFGLLVFEAIVLGGRVAPNTFDGGMQTLFVALLLHNHVAATTLQPFAAMGVTYPQGTTVALAASSILFGWSPMTTPVYLTPLYAPLFLLAAYLWTLRTGKDSPAQAERLGVLVVLFLALVETWPRFLVGGSYDFLFALPLMFLLLGISETALPARRWQDAVLLGVGLGLTASYSVVAAQVLFGLMLVLSLRGPWKAAGNLLGRIRTLGILGGLGLLFVLPSLEGMVEWWSYPGHVLTPLGGSQVPTTATHSSLPSLLPTLLDPFLFRSTDVWLSPFPVLKIVLAVLLVAGALCLVFVALDLWPTLRRELPRRFVVQTLAGVLVTVLLILSLAGIAAALSLDFLPTNVSEVSILLFLFYGMVIVILPLLALEHLPRERKKKLTKGALGIGIAVLILAVPLGAGVVITGVSAPTYIGALTSNLSNVSPGDLNALEWSATHLRSCSTVFAAPGSAAEFLPSYVEVHLDFPMIPAPRNASYSTAMALLVNGSLTPTVVNDLRALNVTEVFVTGQTNVLWKPLLPAPLLADTGNFTLLFHQEDAYIFQFEPVVSSQGCPALPNAQPGV
jgi:hypothetical protein